MQNLFAEKIREYGEKKASAGGKLVEASEKTLADLQAELDKVGNIVRQFVAECNIFHRLPRTTEAEQVSI